MEVSDGVNKRPFRGLGLLNKSQLKLASYIKQNKNVTLEGTKRFMDKSGEYYLKNIQLQNKRKDNVRKSLNQPLNLENCLNKKDINRIKRSITSPKRWRISADIGECFSSMVFEFRGMP